jgi:glycosyltransferase involved in cell wall biosynthesis
MNILVLNFEYPPLGGGASPVCHEINKRYVAAGHSVTVVTMHFKGLADQETIDGVDVIRIACSRHHLHMCSPFEQWTYLKAAKRFLLEWIPSHPVDIVHAHFILPTGILCRFLKKAFGIPYIITAHGSDIPGFNPDRFRFLHLWTPPMIQAIIFDAAQITSPSHFLKNLIGKIAPSQINKVVVIPNGIDASAFTQLEKQPIIVSSGRLLKRKGFGELIQAVKKSTLGYSLHILGEGPMRKKLEARAKGSLASVVFHGWVDNRSPEYKQLLGKAAIYSLVSGKENASIAILEAMASGCAIITSDDSGCPEMVGDAGMLVKHGDVPALQTAIEKLVNDSALQLSLGEKAHARVHAVYNWNTIVQQYEFVLHAALAVESKTVYAEN